MVCAVIDTLSCSNTVLANINLNSAAVAQSHREAGVLQACFDPFDIKSAAVAQS